VTTAEQQRRLAAIMFTDMVGYSALTQRNEVIALELLDEHNRLLRPIISEFHGKEIKTVGDAFLIEFASALDASKCAIAMQKSIHQRNTAGSAPHAEAMHIRIGIHLGDVVYRDGDVFGDGVNIAARIESAAPADGICVSEDVARQVQNKLDVALVNLGRGKLKNIELPVDIYAVQLPWMAAGIHAAAVRHSARRNLLIALPLCMLLAGGWWLWSVRNAVPGQSTAASTSLSIAVLPFVDMSQEKDQAYFSDGLSEELLNLLGRVPQLKVIARTSSFSFRGKEADVATIARALNVGNVLEGSVRKSADRVRITAQLIRASDSSHLWSQTYERKLTDAFAIQDEIATAVVDALKIKLLPAQRASSANHYVPKPEAYDQYLLGRQLMIREQREARIKALEALYKAVEIDSNYAAAHSAIGMVESFIMMDRSTDFAQRSASKARAIASAEKAVALDPLLGDGYATRGFLRYMYNWDWGGADADLRRAIELDPNDAKTPLKYCLLQAAMGDLDNALKSARRATELDPMFSPPWVELARLQGATGDFAGARHSIQRAISITPENVSNRSYLALLSLMEGEPAKAKAYYLEQPDELTRLTGLALAELALGNATASKQAYDAYVARVPGNDYFAAVMYARRGENDGMRPVNTY
jgi:adenylate cyclase